MSDKQRQKRWKLALTVITLAALAFLVYAVRRQLADTLNNLGKVNTWAVLLIIPLEMVNNFSQGKLYQGLFRIIGERFRTRSMFRLSLEMNFVNSIFPSGGVSGFSYLSLRLKGEKVSTAQATLVQMMRFVLIFVAFQILLIFGLLALALGGKANDLVLLLGGSLVTLLVLLTLLITYVIGSKQRINTFFTTITQLLNKLIHFVRPMHPETFNIESARHTFDELHENYMHIRRNLQVLKLPLVFALVANLTEVSAIYVVYIAFGHWVNPGAVILAYAVANFAGLVSVLPGGIGIYEGLMTAVQSAGGIAAALSLPVTIMYRVVNMLAQLPIGYFFYQKNLHATTPIEEYQESIKVEE
ncbi:MAG TPA: lysylphosphatidylglycerol synthase transmembrane domain-containing protein [Candidatus Saccharimonadales bacterium]|nr:lysylphosphatidylglycerol synthase transmembrane domain-containing protein [Candidatus Saccharimonadales bacterium]